MPVAGWTREKGSRRGFINNVTGERISRRQYEKLEAVQASHTTMAPERKAHQDARQRLTNTVLARYTTHQRSLGRTLTKQQARKEQAFKDVMAALRPAKLTMDQAGDPEYMRALRNKRSAALDKIGGSKAFRREYDALYGKPLRRAA